MTQALVLGALSPVVVQRRLEIGAELPTLSKTISQRQIDCYSPVRPNSIHTDDEWARKKGFRAPLAQALTSQDHPAGGQFTAAGQVQAIGARPTFQRSHR